MIYPHSVICVPFFQDTDNDFAQESIVTILKDVDKIPKKHRRAIVNNGGG